MDGPDPGILLIKKWSPPPFPAFPARAAPGRPGRGFPENPENIFPDFQKSENPKKTCFHAKTHFQIFSQKVVFRFFEARNAFFSIFDGVVCPRGRPICMAHLSSAPLGPNFAALWRLPCLPCLGSILKKAFLPKANKNKNFISKRTVVVRVLNGQPAK